MNAREFTFKILLRQRKSGAYSNILLDHEISRSALSPQDKAFATALFYGVIEKQIYLDYQLSCFLLGPLKKLKDDVLIILRLGLYQLRFMQSVPVSAAVNESVKLAKKNRCAYAAGLINATLRNAARTGEVLPQPQEDTYLSVRYSVPVDLIRLWQEDYGEENTLGILKSLENKAQTVLRVNTLLTDTAALRARLEKEGISASVNPAVEHSLIALKAEGIFDSAAYREGLFHIEDTAAQKAALLLGAAPGERVLDVCAAPGGKSFTIAESMGNGAVLACDIYESRVKLIHSGARRLKIDFIETLVHDATQFDAALGSFERVLCDVPCSGLGTIRKKPEIRYKSLEEINACGEVQLQILETSYRYLKEGGTLVYSTCTLHKAENEQVKDAFLKAHPVAVCSFEKTFFPHTDKTDGFYAAVIKKHES